MKQKHFTIKEALVLVFNYHLGWIIAKLCIFIGISKLYKKKELWLIADTRNRFGDNAAALYTYIVANCEEIDVYAVMSAEASPPAFVRKNRVLKTGSLKNALYLHLSDFIAVTHNTDIAGWIKVWKIRPGGVLIRLKHGVIGIKQIKDVSRWNRFDLVCVCSEKEKQKIIEAGVEKERIKITGLARYDGMKREIVEEKIITYVPTWRDVDEGGVSAIDVNSAIGDFAVSLDDAFYDEINIHLYIHQYSSAESFKKSDNYKNLCICSDSVCDIAESIRKSMLLITDYSSVAFDAAMLSIPVVFYMPDLEMYKRNRGIYRDFLENPFGKIYDESSTAIKYIKELILDKNKRERAGEESLRVVKNHINVSYSGQCRTIIDTARKIRNSGRCEVK